MNFRLATACTSLLLALALLPLAPQPAAAQGAANAGFVPVTDAMHENPAPGDWLMWRRTQNGWGYSPLDQINRDNVGDLRMVWTRALREGTNQATPIAYGGVLYVPEPEPCHAGARRADGRSAVGVRAAHPRRRERLHSGTRSGEPQRGHLRQLIIDTANDGYLYALNAQTGSLAWETEILNLYELPARHSTGPIIANGMVVSGRSCRPWAGPEACIIAAHDPRTGAEVWRTRLDPGAGRAGQRDVGRRAVRGARARGVVDGAQLRPRAESRLCRDVGHFTRAEVPARRRRSPAPVPQFDARARRRYGRDPVVLPAPERPLGP